MDDFDVVVIGGGIVGSYLATGLARQGRRVALVERGGDDLAGQRDALPSLHCSARAHMGSTMARNHVLGGNGHYWGGGLIRPENLGLLHSLGINQDNDGEPSPTLATNFSEVEKRLGLGNPVERIDFPFDDGVRLARLSEIAVLPARSRNTPKLLLMELHRHPGCKILSDSELLGFSYAGSGERGRRITSVSIRHQGRVRELSMSACVIAAGTIDSNLIVSAHAGQLGGAIADVCGSGLHDHLSLPIAKVKLGSNPALRQLLAPRFEGGGIIGRRFELQCDGGWGARGFLHFTFQFDEVTPYREIKHLIALRQKQMPLIEQLQACPPLLTAAPALLRIAAERLLRRRLHLSTELSVTATLDFEMFPHPDNTLALRGSIAELAWDIRDEDESSCFELLRKAQVLLGNLAQRHGMQTQPTFDFLGRVEAREYLHATATDAYHLGGGLAAGCDNGAPVDTELRLLGTDNVHVISAAVLARPGVANPTLTLLALADRFVDCN